MTLAFLVFRGLKNSKDEGHMRDKTNMAKKIKPEESLGSPEEKKEDPGDIRANDKIFDQEGELVVNVYETNSDFVVLAAIAGIQIKDLDISLEKDMMVIKGNRCGTASTWRWPG